MDWIQQWQSKLNKQNGVAPLVRTGGSRHTGLAALPHRNIHYGNMGIKKQTQVFVTVSYYFVCKYRKKLPMSKFACSVGNVSEEMLRKYIDNEG